MRFLITAARGRRKETKCGSEGKKNSGEVSQQRVWSAAAPPNFRPATTTLSPGNSKHLPFDICMGSKDEKGTEAAS